MIKQCVGIDVSKDSLSVCIASMDAGQKVSFQSTKSFVNSKIGFQSMLKWEAKFVAADVELFHVMEATGVYYENLAYFLDSMDYQVVVLLPTRVNAFAKSLQWKSKTDLIDVKVIATMGLERKMVPWEVPTSELRYIKRLTRERHELIKQRTQLKNQLHSKQAAYSSPSSSIKRAQKHIKFINDQIQDIEEELHSLVDENEQLNRTVKRLLTIKGLGFISLLTVLAETNCFALFANRKQLTSYCGYDIVERQSGTSLKSKTRISKKGNKHIRRALHYPALSAKLHDQNMRVFYDRIVERKGVKMVGIVAVQRKMLLLIFSIFKSGQVYNPNRLEERLENQPLLSR